MSNTRIERDSMGEVAVPVDALYGASTQRAVGNFPISGQRMPDAFVRALVQVKLAAALANVELQLLSPEISGAVTSACNDLLGLETSQRMQHFPVDVFQTGSGTSSNMNANEVIATLAVACAGRRKSIPTTTSTPARAATT
jgi:fumarate hydratase class II